jgi:hypothetical protein
MNIVLIVAVEFASYLRYCRDLRFEERPDYSHLRQLFRTLFHGQGFTYDYVFDWNMLKFGNARQPTLPSAQQAPMHSQPSNAALPSGTNNDQEHRSRSVDLFVFVIEYLYFPLRKFTDIKNQQPVSDCIFTPYGLFMFINSIVISLLASMLYFRHPGNESGNRRKQRE